MLPMAARKLIRYLQHQPGQINSEADAAPEFNAKVLLAGTAPTSKTFEPSNEADVPATGVTAADTLGGADSAQVHQGYGHPGSGMSSSEARHDGKSHRASDKSGLEGLQGSNKGNIDTA